MPVLVAERRKTRSAVLARDPAASSRTLNFLVLGTDDDAQVGAALDFSLPATYAGMWLDSYRFDYQGGGVWYAEAQYNHRRFGASSFSFDTTGGTAHINVSKETMRSYNWESGDAAPDFKGAIGVNGDSVEGCDITVPVFAFTETHYIPYGLITDVYKAFLFTVTGCTNIGPWRFFNTGEVLFLGARGSQRGGPEHPWEITYSFAASPYRADAPIGNSGNRIIKNGWEYAWTRFKEKTSNGAVVRQPAQTYVERVYEEAYFQDLGIDGLS